MFKLITLALILISWSLLAQEDYGDYQDSSPREESYNDGEYREEPANTEPAPAPREEDPYQRQEENRETQIEKTQEDIPAREEMSEAPNSYEDDGGYNNEERETYEENSYSEDY